MNVIRLEYSDKVDTQNFVPLNIGPNTTFKLKTAVKRMFGSKEQQEARETSLLRMMGLDGISRENEHGIRKTLWIHKDFMPMMESQFGPDIRERIPLLQKVTTFNSLSLLTKLSSPFFHGATVTINAASDALGMYTNAYTFNRQQGVLDGKGPVAARIEALKSLTRIKFDRNIRTQGFRFQDLIKNYGWKSVETINADEKLSAKDKVMIIAAKQGNINPMLRDKERTLLVTEIRSALEHFKQTDSTFRRSLLGTKIGTYKFLHFLEERVLHGFLFDQYVIPMKLGMAANHVNMHASSPRYNGNWNKMLADVMGKKAPLREAFKAISDHVDDVYGMLNYKNLFLNNTFKGLLTLGNFAFSWGHGTVRNLGKAYNGMAHEVSSGNAAALVPFLGLTAALQGVVVPGIIGGATYAMAKGGVHPWEALTNASRKTRENTA
jgi:hypothetical protein